MVELESIIQKHEDDIKVLGETVMALIKRIEALENEQKQTMD